MIRCFDPSISASQTSELMNRDAFLFSVKRLEGIEQAILAGVGRAVAA